MASSKKRKASADEVNLPKKTKLADEISAQQIVAEPSESLTVFVGGIPVSSDESSLRQFFGTCGDISDVVIHAGGGKKKKKSAIAFITFSKWKAVKAALELGGADFEGRELKVTVAGPKPEKAGDVKDSKNGKTVARKDELSVFVRGLPWSIEQNSLARIFSQCGRIDRLILPKKEGESTGIAFVQFSTKAGVEKALELNGTEFAKRTILVSGASEVLTKPVKEKKETNNAKVVKSKDTITKKPGGARNPEDEVMSEAARGKVFGDLVAFEGEKTTFDSDSE